MWLFSTKQHLNSILTGDNNGEMRKKYTEIHFFIPFFLQQIVIQGVT